jgi:hypothetical protein
MAQRQARDGKEAAKSLIADEAAEDLLSIGKLMQKWEQVERRDGTAVVTQPEQARTVNEADKTTQEK